MAAGKHKGEARTHQAVDATHPVPDGSGPTKPTKHA